MPKNDGLSKALKGKNDEFYTQLNDIEKELKNYKIHFKNKVVFCNCDDPFESNFFKYFALNFNMLGLKKLICTCYNTSPILGTQLSLFDVDGVQLSNKKNKKAYKIVISKVEDLNNDGAVDMLDIQQMVKTRGNVLTLLKGDGDFRSDECKKILESSDVVVTNPPFSLFREYVNLLFEYEKAFIIIGNQNSITYKDFFPFIKENKVWLGASIHSGDREFQVPDSYPLQASGCRVDENGKKYIRVKGVRWWTNIDYQTRHEDLILYKKYNKEEYPKYDNYEAINVDKTSDIPYDYDGVMGVPITFLDKYNPDQFEIIWLACGNSYANMPKEILKYLKFDPSIKYGGGLGTGIVNGKPKYARILIKRKK